MACNFELTELVIQLALWLAFELKDDFAKRTQSKFSALICQFNTAISKNQNVRANILSNLKKPITALQLNFESLASKQSNGQQAAELLESHKKCQFSSIQTICTLLRGLDIISQE